MSVAVSPSLQLSTCTGCTCWCPPWAPGCVRLLASLHEANNLAVNMMPGARWCVPWVRWRVRAHPARTHHHRHRWAHSHRCHPQTRSSPPAHTREQNIDMRTYEQHTLADAGNTQMLILAMSASNTQRSTVSKRAAASCLRKHLPSCCVACAWLPRHLPPWAAVPLLLQPAAATKTLYSQPISKQLCLLRRSQQPKSGAEQQTQYTLCKD